MPTMVEPTRRRLIAVVASLFWLIAGGLFAPGCSGGGGGGGGGGVNPPPGGGTVSRSFSVAVYTPGRALDVTLTVSPNSGTTTQTVSETPPAGWTSSAISQGGVAAGSSITWSFADGNARTLTYTVTPPAEATGSQSFSGTASFNGTATSTGGVQALLGAGAEGAVTARPDPDVDLQGLELIYAGQVLPLNRGDLAVALPAAADTTAVCAIGNPAGGTTTPVMMSFTTPTGVSRAQNVVKLDAQTTATALVFMRMAGFLWPENLHSTLLDLIASLPVVQQFGSELLAVLRSDRDWVRDWASHPQLQTAFQAALDAATEAASRVGSLVNALVDLFQPPLPARHATSGRGFTVAPASKDGIDVAVSGDQAQATNWKALWRTATVYNPSGESLGSVWLKDRSLVSFSGPSATALRPAALPSGSPLTLLVSGGIKDAGAWDVDHIAPWGITVVLRIVYPGIKAMAGISSLGNTVQKISQGFDPQAASPFGDPLADYLVRKLVVDLRNPGDFFRTPTYKLALNLSRKVANGESVDIVQELVGWFINDVLVTLASDIPGLALAVAGTISGQVAVEVLAKALALIAAPPVVALLQGVALAKLVADAGPAGYDLVTTPYTTVFTLTPDTPEVDPDPPLLDVQPASLLLRSSQSSASIEIRNVGGGNLEWSVTCSQPWVRPSATTGTGIRKLLQLTVDRSGLTPGSHQATVQINSNGGSFALPVTAKVAGLDVTVR